MPDHSHPEGLLFACAGRWGLGIIERERRHFKMAEIKRAASHRVRHPRHQTDTQRG